MNDKPSQATPYPLRLPDKLKAKIKAVSNKSGRSMNAEIIHRLENTFPLFKGENVGFSLVGFPEGAKEELQELFMDTLLKWDDKKTPKKKRAKQKTLVG